jgi:2-iminobutanoate/2-iminopropanoate deaminase
MKKKILKPEGVPQPVGPYNHLVKIGKLLFASGQIPLDPATGQIVSEDISQQAHQVLKNVGALLKSAELSYPDVVKVTMFLTNLDDFAEVNRIYAEYFTDNFPARSTIQVSRLPLGAKFELEFVAAISD